MSTIDFPDTQATWVWPSFLGVGPNQYTDFAHVFKLDTASRLVLTLSVDTTYAIWLNGTFITAGQCRDFELEKTWDTCVISPELLKATNVLLIQVHYVGCNTASTVTGRPGLIYSLVADQSVVASSGTSTRWRKNPCYVDGDIERVTSSLEYTFSYRNQFNGHPDTLQATTVSTWALIKECDQKPAGNAIRFNLWPISKPVVHSRTAASITAQGYYKKGPLESSAAERLQTCWLSPSTIFSGSMPIPLSKDAALKNVECPDEVDGIYIVVDLGREECGYFEMELTSTRAIKMDMGWGEHLDDLRVRSKIGPRNFGVEYSGGPGAQTFTHWFSRWGARYLFITISGETGTGQQGFREGDIVLHYVGLRPSVLPISEHGAFSSDNKMAEQINNVCKRTLLLCMQEHYEDCPWREQGLFASDARNQALAGYYVFGEYKFPLVSLDLLRRTMKEDGYICLTAPGSLIDLTIPTFSMAWILAVREFLLYSGKPDQLVHFLPTIEYMIDHWSATIKNGLMPSPVGKGYWHFYDWVNGMDGTCAGNCLEFDVLTEERFDAPLNYFFILALEAAVSIFNECGYSPEKAKRYNELVQSIRSACRTFFSYEDERSILVRSLAIASKVVSQNQATDLLAAFEASENGFILPTFSQSIFVYQVLFSAAEHNSAMRSAVFSVMTNTWGQMLKKGATSFWEVSDGSWAYDGAGSLCHGWSTLPAYFFGAYGLGIRPLTPGFKTFLVDPGLQYLPGAEGIVPTPEGPICIKWRPEGGKAIVQISHPKSLTPIFSDTVVLE